MGEKEEQKWLGTEEEEEEQEDREEAKVCSPRISKVEDKVPKVNCEEVEFKLIVQNFNMLCVNYI